MFRDPNDGAYEKDEVRTGPPLSYVAEKLRRAAELMHFLTNRLNAIEELDSEQKSNLLSQARGSLRYQLTGYLALNNMLALVNDQGFFERIESYSYDDFNDWLDRINQQGSVSG
jgi:hypothetical protein